jgi:hypothetical protein
MRASVAVTRPVNLHSICISCLPSGNVPLDQNCCEELTCRSHAERASMLSKRPCCGRRHECNVSHPLFFSTRPQGARPTRVSVCAHRVRVTELYETRTHTGGGSLFSQTLQTSHLDHAWRTPVRMVRCRSRWSRQRRALRKRTYPPVRRHPTLPMSNPFCMSLCRIEFRACRV